MTVPGWLIYVPGLWAKEDHSRALRARLAQDLPHGWEIRYWDHGIKPWTRGSMDSVARRLHVRLASWLWLAEQDSAAPERIVVVGHSLGGIVARHAYVLGRRALSRESSTAVSDWASLVSRLVLLAAPNRGFVNSRLAPWLRPLYAITAATQALVVEDLRRGSPYLTELRLRWIDLFRGESGLPEVVQVVGDRDHLVYADDSEDVTFMPGSVQIPLPDATHGDIPVIDPPHRERYPILRHAVIGPLDERAAKRSDSFPDGRAVITVLHGIRSGKYGTWVPRLATLLRDKNPGDDLVVRTPSYGYLSAFGFAVPVLRQRQLRSFLDWHADDVLRHGRDHLSFAGHSNGTYLLGQALQHVPAMRFRRIFLAGSVLPRDYRWSTIFTRGQVTDGAHSDRGSKDWPVGWLCSALHGLGMRDVGTGGFVGFDDTPDGMTDHCGWYAGGHGAPLETEDRLSGIADYLLGGEYADQPDGKPTMMFQLGGRMVGSVAPVVAVGGVALAIRWYLQERSWKRLGVAAGAVWLAWVALSSA